MLNGTSRKSYIGRILALLVESGLIYSALWVCKLYCTRRPAQAYVRCEILNIPASCPGSGLDSDGFTDYWPLIMAQISVCSIFCIADGSLTSLLRECIRHLCSLSWRRRKRDSKIILPPVNDALQSSATHFPCTSRQITRHRQTYYRPRHQIILYSS